MHWYMRNDIYSQFWILQSSLSMLSQLGNSLVLQWFGHCAFIAKGLGSIPSQGTKISQAMWYDQKWIKIITACYTKYTYLFQNFFSEPCITDQGKQDPLSSKLLHLLYFLKSCLSLCSFIFWTRRHFRALFSVQNKTHCITLHAVLSPPLTWS